jgi:hypothetical protein
VGGAQFRQLALEAVEPVPVLEQCWPVAAEALLEGLHALGQLSVRIGRAVSHGPTLPRRLRHGVHLRVDGRSGDDGRAARYGGGMLRALVLVALSGFPVSTPSMGRLTVGEAIQTPAAVTIPLQYLNDTPDARHARVRCTLLTKRGDVVNTDSAKLEAVKPGESRALRMRIVDSSASSDKASCEVEWSQGAP